MAPRYEICVGLNKGHKTTKIKQLQYRGDRKVKGIRPSRTKGVSRNSLFVDFLTELSLGAWFFRLESG